MIGILAGMWPCGIIAFVRELFNAESKSQVYSHLHQYLQDNAVASTKLSEFYALISITITINTL